MITFQEIEIITKLDSESLNQNLVQHLADGWSHGDIRSPQNESNRAKSSSCYSYSCLPSKDRPSAALFLAEKSDGLYWVSNICPAPGSPNPLSYELYNLILNDFYRTVLRPLEVQGVMQVTISSPDYKIEQHLSSEAYRCLSAFAESANKSTGRGHPSDLAWWLDFLIAVSSQPQRRPEVGMLGRWFLEEAGWEGWKDRVSELQDDYEFGLSLLGRKAR